VVRPRCDALCSEEQQFQRVRVVHERVHLEPRGPDFSAMIGPVKTSEERLKAG
jgi:hypothetical protein